MKISKSTEILKYWILERQKIFTLKEAGAERPWTSDPILDTYRFCNVYREQDKVTRWIAANLRNEADRYPWFTMTLARLINLPESLTVLKRHLVDDTGTLAWNRKTFTDIIHDRSCMGKKNFNPAYIVSTNGFAMEKGDYLGLKVLQPLWDDRDSINRDIRKAKSLEEVHTMLKTYNGLASFMAAQVVADLKHYSRFMLLPDHLSFAAPGPGSKRGMNRILGRETQASMSDTLWTSYMSQLYPYMSSWAEREGLPPLDAQDLQNCLCEYDKYMRAKTGEGTPKQKYQGGK